MAPAYSMGYSPAGKPISHEDLSKYKSIWVWNALEQGQSVQRITERINKREAEKKELEKQLAIEKRKK